MAATQLQPDVILSQIEKAGNAYLGKQPGSREQLLNLGHALIASLELPSEAIQRIGWAEHLAAMNVVGEKDSDIYIALPLTKALTEARYRDGIVYTYDVAGPSFRSMPEYLKGIKYSLPTELTNGAFQYAHKTDLPFFAWLDKNPPYLSLFNSYMSAYRAGKPSWVDPGFYPIADRLSSGFDASKSDVILVDVGGGLGHDMQELKTKHPSLPGRLVLQDRPEVIANATEAAGGIFDSMSHDFFTTQPIKSARAYYLHSVLHDWGDEDCAKILQQLKPAMRAGYSKLLINEIIVPDQNPSWPVTSMDQLVFALGAMKERTEADWRGILERAGFYIVKIFGYEMGSESLIEAELA
ncbi:MAG: hypothetical protein Q9165_007116 [Trypethelium subeluteriae]